MQAHTFAKILLLSLAISVLASPNHSSIDARKLATPNGVFRVDLIHRDSPHSPYYDPSITPQERLKRAPLGSISRGHNIRLSPIYYDIQNNAQLSSLIPGAGDYLIQITIGTPQIEVIAAADTGSDLLWTQCSQCDPCVEQKSPFFDPTKSSTFQLVPCNSPTCSYSDLTTNCTSDSTTASNSSSSVCTYGVLYGDGSQSAGLLATDAITLPSPDATSMTLPSAVFGCGLAQLSQNDEAGIVGLGTGPASLVSQLGSSIDYKFSYCLAPLSSGVNSKLTFGADIMGPEKVSTPFTTGQQSHHYYLSLDSITIEAKDSPVKVPVGINMVVIDSGTTLTYLPTSVYRGVRDALAKAIALSSAPSPLEPYDLCYEASSGQHLNPPDLVFHFEGADVVLKAINTFREVNIGNGFMCLAMVATEDDVIFGNIAQVNFQVEYDLKANQVSFARADCTTH